jgi:UDP-N-acetyl-2-amino-2-deoxyglucuronate dehydrogenase
MNQTPIAFGLVGCGRVAPRHADSISEQKDARLAAVADVVVSRSRYFAEKYHADAYTRYSDLLAREDIDIINICTPSGLHAQMAIEAMRAGKHVICEKPMALSLEDADRMIDTSKQTGQRLCVVLQNRYNPPMQDLYQLVRSGKLGRLLLGNATVRWYRPQEYYNDEWHGTLHMDGGALMNQSIHHIDALQWLMGDIESVFAYTGTLAHQMEAEDVGVAVIRFSSGALATIEGSTVTYPENLEGSVTLFGTRGSVKVGGTALNRKVFWKVEGELQNEKELLIREQLDPTSVYGSSHKAVIVDMITAVREGRQPRTDGAAARNSVAIVLAMYESARSGQPVMMNNGNWSRKE